MAGSSGKADSSSPWRAPGLQPPSGLPSGPRNPPSKPGTAGALLAPCAGPPDHGSTASRRWTRLASPSRRAPACPPGPWRSPHSSEKLPVTPGLLQPCAEQLGMEGAAGAWSPTPRTRTPARWEEEGEGREDAEPHGRPRARWHEAQLGRGCLQGLPALAAGRRPALWALLRNSLWAVMAEGLSCSGPSCPPPAPACSGAAAAEPAHPSPGLSGSHPCTW